MAIATKTNAPSRSTTEGNAIASKGQVLSGALPQTTAKPLVIDKEELLEQNLAFEELPQALEANPMGDVLMAQASVPAAGAGTGAAAATTATAAVPAAAATAATATGFAGMSGLGLLGAAAGVVGVAAVASSGGSNPPPVPPVPLFSMTDVANVVKFSGTAAATGNITVSIVDGVATFSRGANQASSTVTGLDGKTIDLAAGQVLNMTLAQFKAVEGLKITGAGNVFVDGTALSGTSAVTDSVLINVVLNSGNLTFDLPADDNDILKLKVGSVIDLKGGNLIVDDGQLDAKLVAAGAFNVQGNVILNSGLILTVAQLEQVDGQLITDGTGKLEIIVSTVAEANALAGLLESRAPTQAGVSVPAVSFSIPADAPAAALVNAALVDALVDINVAVKQNITANSIITVLSIEVALSLGADLPDNYVINATVFDFADNFTVATASVEGDKIIEVLANAKAPVPAIADIVTLSLTDSLSVLLKDSNAAILALAKSITLNDTATTAAALNTLDGKTSVSINAQSVTTLEGTAAEIATALSSNGIATSGATNLTVSDGADTTLAATALSDLRGKTTGPVTVTNAVVITGTAAELTAALVTPVTPVVAGTATVSVSDAATTALTASDLSALGGKTAGVVTVTNAVNITGTADQLMAALVTDSTRVVARTATVTLTDVPTPEQLASITGAETGAVVFKTFTAAEFTALAKGSDPLPTAKDYNFAGGTIDAGTFTLTKLARAIDRYVKLVDGAVTFVEPEVRFAIEDTAINLLAASDALSADRENIPELTAVTVTGGDAGVLSVEDQVVLKAVTTDDTWTYTLSDSIENLLAADNAVLEQAGGITTTSSTANASDLNTLDGKTAAPIDATSVTMLTGKAAEIATAFNSDGISRADDIDVALTDAPASLDDLNAIRRATTGEVTLKTFTLVEALALVNGDAAPPAAETYNIETGTVELDTVSVEKLLTIDKRFAALEIGAVNLIAKGDITATFTIKDTAANLLAVVGDDVIDGATAIIVIDAIGTVLAAKDLTDLADIQGTGPVTVTNAVVITGTAAELTAALVTPVSAASGTSETRVSAINATVVVNGVAVVGSTESNAISLIAGATSGVITVNGTEDANTLDFSGYGLDVGTLTINGLDGNDIITGNSRNDTINGGLGNDIINGGSGADTLTGGGGQDTFTLALGGAGTVITDFTAGPREDRIDTADDMQNVNISAIEGADFFNYTSGLKSIDGSVKDQGGLYQADSEGFLDLRGNTIIFELEDATTDSTKAGLITALGNIGNTAFEIDDSLLFINYLTSAEDGAQVWSFTAANAGGVDETELTLLATLTNVQVDSLDYTNFIA